MRYLAPLAVVLALVTPVGVRAGIACPGDCDGNGQVTIDEMVGAVNIALGAAPLADCNAADRGGDGNVTIDDLVAAVAAALEGCGTVPTPTVRPTVTPTSSEQTTIKGRCRVPGADGLVSCAVGTLVTAYRCENRETCAARDLGGASPLGSTMVVAAGAFSIQVDAALVREALLRLDANIAGATIFRSIVFGALRSGFAGVRPGGRGRPVESELTVIIDPSSEGASRAFDTAGLQNLEDIDGASVNDQVRARSEDGTQYAGLTPADAAALAESHAFEVVFVEPSAVAVSADDSFACVVSFGDDALALLRRDMRTGEWAATRAVQDGIDGVDGLNGASGVAISGDGRHVYVVGGDEDAITVFAVEQDRQQLRFVGFERDIDSLEGAQDVLIDPSGRFIYVAGTYAGTIAVFARDSSTGGLDFVQRVPSSLPEAVRLSPDGRHLYAASAFVEVFTRDEQSGRLSRVDAVDVGEYSAEALAISPDGAFVYAAGRTAIDFPFPVAPQRRIRERGLTTDTEVAVIALRRDTASGRLTVVQTQLTGVNPPDGLGTVDSLAITPDGAHLYALDPVQGAVAIFRRDLSSGRISLVESTPSESGLFSLVGGAGGLQSFDDGARLLAANLATTGVDQLGRNVSSGRLIHEDVLRGILVKRVGLRDPHAVTVSPDGANVYVAGLNDDTVAIFARDPQTSRLSYRGAVRGGEAGIAELLAPLDLVVSPDGHQLYVAALLGVVVFDRNPATGDLTLLEVVRDGRPLGESAFDARGLAFSGDGEHLYVAGLTGTDTAPVGGVFAYSRNPATGRLTLLEIEQNGAGGVRGLTDRADEAALAPDGRHLYVTSYVDESIVVFARDAASGALTFVEAILPSRVMALDTPTDIVVSPDNRGVYVTSGQTDAVLVFLRDTTSGTLTLAEVETDRDEVLARPLGLAASRDGRHLFVASDVSDTIAVFERNPDTATLRRVQVLRDSTGNVNGLGGVNAVAPSPDGACVYSTAGFDAAIAVFRRSGDGVLDYVEVQR